MTQLERARELLRHEADVLRDVAEHLDESFTQAVERLWACGAADGRVGISGVGKSADIAQKLVGTFNSTGTRAYLLDATRALHGDLGMVHSNDAIVILSNSGESEEIVRLLKPLRRMCASVIAITGNKSSTLAVQSDTAVAYGAVADRYSILRRAPARSWPCRSDMPWPSPSVIAENSLMRSSLAFIRPGVLGSSCLMSKSTCVKGPSCDWRRHRTPCVRSLLRRGTKGDGPVP